MTHSEMGSDKRKPDEVLAVLENPGAITPMAKSSKRSVRKQPTDKARAEAPQGKYSPKKGSPTKKTTASRAKAKGLKPRPPGAAHAKGPRLESSRGPIAQDLQRDMDAREALLEGSLEQVYSVYDEGLAEGIDLPVVFLVDCEDEIGARMAGDWVGKEEVEEAIAENRSQGQGDATTTFAQCLSFYDCQTHVPQMFPYLRGTFEQAPPGETFVAVVVARGGAGTFFVPWEGNDE